MTGSFYGFRFMFAPQHIFFLLEPDIVVAQHIPQQKTLLNVFRQIRRIGFGYLRTESLQANQDFFLRHHLCHGKGMGILRAEAVHDVGLKILYNPCKPVL